MKRSLCFSVFVKSFTVVTFAIHYYHRSRMEDLTKLKSAKSIIIDAKMHAYISDNAMEHNTNPFTFFDLP